MNKLENVTHLVGDTPLVKLNRSVEYRAANLYVKLESRNPTGSYTDREILNAIEQLEAQGMRAHATLIMYEEAPYNVSLAYFSAVKGYNAEVFFDEETPKIFVDKAKKLGAKVHIVPKDVPKEVIEEQLILKERSDNDYVIRPQYDVNNVDVHQITTGAEIVEALGHQPDAFVLCPQKGAVLTGVSQAFNRGRKRTQIFAVEDAKHPYLNQSEVGDRYPLLDTAAYQKIIQVSPERTRQQKEWLIVNEGLFVEDIGARAVAASVAVARQLGEGHDVVVFIPFDAYSL